MQASEKIRQLRTILTQQQLDGFLIHRGDEFLNEYVAPYAERLAWLTGFTGSAGLAVVLPQQAAVFSDGRYILQMEQQLDPALWEHYHSALMSPLKWITEKNILSPLTPLKIGYDPKLVSKNQLDAFQHANISLIPMKINPIDQLWQDQPLPPAQPIIPHSIEFSGQSHHEKIKQLQEELKTAKEDAYILCDPASICWLLNIRGSDIPYTPIPLIFAIIHTDRICLYANPEQYNPTLQDFLGTAIQLRSHNQLENDLQQLHGKNVGLDLTQTPLWFIQKLQENQSTFQAHPNPCSLPKARKNPIEQDGARKAHLRDGIALCRFLYWLEQDAAGLTEYQIAERSNQFRKEAGQEFYKEESFPAISAIGANGAIIHYATPPDSQTILTPNQSYLIDSGGQYKDGTTDVTRTLWIGDALPPNSFRNAFTRVLKGHIALTTAIFPKGTTGSQLDVLARYALWQAGLNYDHGTGHGVGSFLSVHEGPCRISSYPNSVALEAGMILSNEPGYYLPQQYGIRLENLVLVQPAAYEGFLQFEPLTLAPFDLKSIKTELLTQAEKNWLNQYHAKIQKSISPFLSQQEKTWLMKTCLAI